MKLHELFEDGRVVKNVNTTIDVKPGEIKRQAKKFGNTFDSDNRPPNIKHSIKVAGKKDKKF